MPGTIWDKLILKEKPSVVTQSSTLTGLLSLLWECFLGVRPRNEDAPPGALGKLSRFDGCPSCGAQSPPGVPCSLAGQLHSTPQLLTVSLLLEEDL